MKIYIHTIIIGQRNGDPLIEITCNAVQDNNDGIKPRSAFYNCTLCARFPILIITSPIILIFINN